MRKYLALLLGGAVAVTGCGGSDAKESIALADLPAKVAPAYCALVKHCNSFFYDIAYSVEDCAATFEKQYSERSFSEVQKAVTDKKANYDGVSAAACVSAIASNDCSFLDNTPIPACQQAVVGTVSDGGGCDLDAECSATSRCVITNNACPGTCSARASAGVACSTNDDCAAGLVCSNATQHCVAPAAEGDKCGGGVEVQCKVSLLCVGEDAAKMQSGTCKQPKDVFAGADGATCDIQKGPWCQDGLSCVIDSIDAGTPVEKCHPKAAAGGMCGIAIPSQCADTEYCPLTAADLGKKTFTAQCLALPAEGAACGAPISGAACGPNLRCDPDTQKCAKIRDLGETCASNELCYSGNCQNKVCVPTSACPM